MRIAVLIIGLLLGIIMFVQTVIVYGLGSAVDDEASATAAAGGIFMSLLWLAACAFVLPFPMISVACFAIAALIGFGLSADFPDLAVWGGISVILAILSLLGWFGKRRDRRRERIKEQAQAERDARYEALLSAQHRQPNEQTQAALACPACGRQNAPGTKFCAECGARVSSPALGAS